MISMHRRRWARPAALAVAILGLLVTQTLLAPAKPAHAAEEVYLGTENDKCSGQLKVEGKVIPRTPTSSYTSVDVTVDKDGYWYWDCNEFDGHNQERSRGVPDYRYKVKHLKVWHAYISRDIVWLCYDVV